jgi:hypothetical protein
MAGTIKTAPHRVNTRDGHIPVKEAHDHSDGTCDLPATPELFTSTRCTWEQIWDGVERVCGCHVCTEHDRRRRERRRNRHQTRNNLRRLLKDGSDD